MPSKTPEEYIDEQAIERKQVIVKLRKTILSNLPNGFLETMSYGMIGYVVPHALYPKGYHCDTAFPLPFLSIASQKNFVAIYHIAIYTNPVLLNWFVQEYPKHCKTKLDMGKSCIRFKKMEDLPYELIGELSSKMSVQKWITCYENTFRK